MGSGISSSASSPRQGRTLITRLPHDASALNVANAIFQNAVEQRPPFLGRSRSVAMSQLHHGILHDVERIGFMAQRDLCDPEGLPLHLRQKGFERACGILGRITQVGFPEREQIGCL